MKGIKACVFAKTVRGPKYRRESSTYGKISFVLLSCKIAWGLQNKAYSLLRRSIFLAGTTTTCRLKGAHHVLRQWIGKYMTGVWESVQIAIILLQILLNYLQRIVRIVRSDLYKSRIDESTVLDRSSRDGLWRS